MKSARKSKPKLNNSENNLIKSYMKEQLLYIAVYIIIFIISCVISLICGVSEADINYFSIVTFVVSGLLCGYISGFKNRKNGIIVGLKSISVPSFLIIIISIVVNGFDISIIRMLISATLMIAAGIVGGIAGVNTRIKPKKRVKK